MFKYVLNYVFTKYLLNYVLNYVLNYAFTKYLLNYVLKYVLNYVFTNYVLKSKLFLGIPTIIFEGFDTYEYEDCFAMHHFYVSTAVAIAGCAKLNNDKLKPILVSEDRSGQLLQQKIRNSITDMDEHLFCGSKHYDKIYYLFLLTLHPQNKNRSIVLFAEQFNNIEENPDLEKEIDEDNAVEDADVYFPV